MYRISELAKMLGLSRSTLLYYEKQGLLHGTRQANGYRLYSDKDAQKLRLLQQFQAGGLTLAECQACLDRKLDAELLKQRLQQLDEDIARKQEAGYLLSALLGGGSLRSWHQQTDQLAPDAHLAWLQQQGFDQKQALHIKWLSKDMNEHEHYMNDFMTVFQKLERWGPGSDTDTLNALSSVPIQPQKIVDIGCGKGFATQLLAQHTQARIIALDNEQSALDKLAEHLRQQKLEERITLTCASMTSLPFPPNTVDLIWSEGSAYIMGVTQALTQWQPMLRTEGCLVLSDLVWLTDTPSPPSLAFWQQEYPDMQTVTTRLEQMRHAGFCVVADFTMSKQAWLNYYQPLKNRLQELGASMPDSAAIADMSREVAIYENHLGEFGYHMFVLQKMK